MDAVAFLKENISFDKLLDYYKIKYQTHGGKIRCKCPIHGGSNPTSFVVHLKKGLYFCHTSCKEGSDIVGFVMRMEHIDFMEAVHFLSDLFKLDITNMTLKRAVDYMSETKDWIEQMNNILFKSEIEEYDISKLGELYTINKYRHYTKETLEHFGIKFCETAIIPLENSEIYVNKRVVVPIYQNSVMVGVTMRKTQNEKIKWLHQPSNIHTGDLLYNMDDIEQGMDNVIMVEGCPDVWSVYQSGYTNVVGLFGAHMTDNQEKILLTKTYNVISALDTDYAGIKGALSIYERLKYKMNVRFADIPILYDIGELNKDTVQQIIENPITYKEWIKKDYVLDVLNNCTMSEWNNKYKEVN